MVEPGVSAKIESGFPETEAAGLLAVIGCSAVPRVGLRSPAKDLYNRTCGLIESTEATTVVIGTQFFTPSVFE